MANICYRLNVKLRNYDLKFENFSIMLKFTQSLLNDFLKIGPAWEEIQLK